MKALCLLCIAILGAATICSPAMADDSESLANWCEQQWLAQSAEYANTEKEAPDFAGMLDRWLQFAPKCRGTVAYEARLSFLYFYLDQPAKAKEILRPVAKQPSPYSDLVQLGEIVAEMKDQMLAHQMDAAHLQEADGKLSEFVKRYPQRVEGYAFLVPVKMELRRYEEAITLLQTELSKANGIRQDAGIYRNLTICLAEVKRYQEAYDAGGMAVSLRKAFMGDPPFVYAVARADAGLGRFSDADTALRVIVAKKPDVKTSPAFLSTVAFVIDKIKESKGDVPAGAK